MSITKEEINTLPLISYQGSLVVVKTKEEWEAVYPAICAERVLGFDIEAKPTYIKGPQNPPAIMQLATLDTVYIVQFYKLRLLPSMINILTNPEIIKAGVAIVDDMRALQKLAKFKYQSVVDLAGLAKQQGIQAAGLRSLTACLLNSRITKTMQCSNWERIKLSHNQLLYAATDAWISRELYLILNDYTKLYI